MSALQVLLNDDLTRHVFYNLLSDRRHIDNAGFPDPSEHGLHQFRRTCYALALVCKGLSDAALDALWENLFSLVPLFRLLSNVSCLVGATRQYHYMISNSIHPHEWERLQSYAKRTRRLQMTDKVDAMSAGLLKALWAMCGDHALFPNLQDLRANASHLQRDLMLFMPPSLRHVRLHNFHIVPTPTDYDVHNETLVMETLARSPMELHTLSIHEVDLTALAAAVIPKLLHLRSLALVQHPSQSGVNYLPLFLSLSSMTHLHTLYLKIDFDTVVDLPLTHVLFMHSLESLTLNGRTRLLDHLLRRLSLPRIRSMSIYGSNLLGDTVKVLRDCTASVSRCFHEFSREPTISLFFFWHGRTVDMEDGAQPGPLPFLQIVQPLMELRNMKSLSVCVTPLPPALFTDADVELLASAWPELQSLVVDDTGQRLQERPSFNALNSFVHHCPDLRLLYIPVDCSPPINDAPQLPGPSHRLVNLQLDMGITEPLDRPRCEPIARHLHALFPFLDLEMLLLRGITSTTNPWHSVLLAIQKLQATSGQRAYSPDIIL